MPRARRRRFTPQDKRRLLEETTAPGASVSAVARRYGISPSLLFRWRRLMNLERNVERMGGLDVRAVPRSQVQHLQAQVRELERLLGKKTLEAEILKEAIARSKKQLLRSKLPDSGDGD